MSKKRTSAESSKDEQTSEGSYALQEDDDAKRARLASLYDTTLQDLPIELLECILVKAVVMEVKGMKLVKRLWKQKADLVICRLGAVCLQWSSILTTDFFRKEVRRILDDQETIRLEILHQPSIQLGVMKLTTLKDEIFLICSPHDRDDVMINVYDLNNMAEVKDVIPLPTIRLGDMAACSVSNCVYILNRKRHCPSIYRITKDEDHHFKVSSWVRDLKIPVYNRGPISVSANGNLIIISRPQNLDLSCKPMYKPGYVGIYDANGSLLHDVHLRPDICGFRYIHSAIQKSNGNLVLLSVNDKYKTKVLETDTTGKLVRQYQSSLGGGSVVSFADIHGRILINDHRNKIQLLDPEFNPLEIAGPRLLEGHLMTATPQVHFNSERNEIVRVEVHNFDQVNRKFEATVLNIFRFTE